MAAGAFFLSHPWYFCSTSQLRRLCLVCCYYITDKKLSELAAKLPLLEELDMTISSTSEELLKALKAFGRYYPIYDIPGYTDLMVRSATSFLQVCL